MRAPMTISYNHRIAHLNISTAYQIKQTQTHIATATLLQSYGSSTDPAHPPSDTRLTQPSIHTTRQYNFSLKVIHNQPLESDNEE